MSKLTMRNDFLNFYRMAVTGETYYLSDKFPYNVQQVNKAVRINDVLYKVTDPTRNSARFLESMANARRAFVKEKNKLLQSVVDCNDSDINYIGSMYASVANGFLTLFADYVKFFAGIPVSEEQLNKVCVLAGRFSTNTYNELTNMQSRFSDAANTVFHSAAYRPDSYNAQTQAQFDSMPKFGVFFGNTHNDMFGNTHVTGGFYTDTSRQYAESYVAMAQNKVAAEAQEQNDLACLKENSIKSLDDFAVLVIKNFNSELRQLIIDEIDDVFDYTVFCEKGLVNRPFEGKLWQESFANVPKEDYSKLKILFDFYGISYNDYIQIPLFDKLFAECGITADYDAYDCKEKEIFFFFKNYTSLKDDWYFPRYLAKCIKEKIDAEFEAMDLSHVGKTDELFADISRDVQANKYLEEAQKREIDSHIYSKKAVLRAKRGY